MAGRIIAVAVDDDAASLADRLEWANASRVIAHCADAFRLDDVGWARVKRAALQRGTVLAIVSPHGPTRTAASEAGITAFRAVDEAAAMEWIAEEEWEPTRRLTPPRRFSPGSLRRFFPQRNWTSIGLRVFVAVVAVTTVAGAGFAFVPAAQVTLSASSQSLQTIVPVSLTLQPANASIAKRTVLAQRVDVIVDETFGTPTTGEKSIPSFKARGTVTFFNVLTTPFKVPKDTVLRASASGSAARFVTLAEVEVPAGGQANAEIEAIEVGGEGNVPGNTINVVEGVPAIAVRVSNENPTTGGGGTTVRAANQDDFRRLRALARERLLVRAAQEMLRAPEVARDGWYVLPDSLYVAETQDETFDRFVTEEATELKLTLRLQVAGLAVNPVELDTVARAALTGRTPSGFDLLTARAERGDVAEEGTGTRVEYFMTARGIAGAAIDENDVRKLIRGQSVDEARRLLQANYRLTGAPTIELGPDWLPAPLRRLPLLPMRIDVSVRRE